MPPITRTPLTLDADEQFVLDEVVTDQFQNGEPTKLDDILLTRLPDQVDVLRAAVASLKTKGCLERHQPQAYLHLTATGLLASHHGADVAALAERLLAYLLKRHSSDRSRFTHFTWDDLKAGGVVALDTDFARTTTIINAFDIYKGRSGVAPDRVRWEVPKDLVEMRSMKSVHDLLGRAGRIAAERRGETTPGPSAQPPAAPKAFAPEERRTEEAPNLLLAYPESLPSANLQAFVDAVADGGVRLQVDRNERGPYAGVELLLPTVAFLLLAKGFLEEAGKDGYQALKRGLAELWPVFFGTERSVRVRAVASSPGKLTDHDFSRAFSAMAVGDGGRKFKLLLRDDATLDEVEASFAAFVDLLASVDAGKAPPFKYQGGFALVAYDPGSRTLYFPDAYASAAAVTMKPEDKLTFNLDARALLAMLYRGYCGAKGKDFWVVPTEEALQELGYDFPSYKQAAGRLVDRGLAKWKGQVEVTITGGGVEASEDDARLELKLPVSKGEIMSMLPDKKKVFIIHGRNVDARIAIEHFLKALGLAALDFDQIAADMGTEFVGNIVAEGLNRAHGIVSLFTPDEYSALATPLRGGQTGREVERWQARPNVIFEAGMAFATARERSVIVTLGGDVSLFSDVAGIHILRLDNTIQSRNKFRQKLIGMGCEVDLRGDSYTDPARSGDFDAAVAALSGVSPRDPFRP